MSRPSKSSRIAIPTLEEDRAITAAAKRDPDARPLTPKQLKSMVPLRERKKGRSRISPPKPSP